MLKHLLDFLNIFKEITGFSTPYEMAFSPLQAIKTAWIASIFALVSIEQFRVFFEAEVYPSLVGVMLLIFIYIVNFVIAAYYNVYISKTDKNVSYQKALRGFFKLVMQLLFVILANWIVKEYSKISGLSSIFHLPLSEFLLLNFTINRFLNCWEVAHKMNMIETRTYSLVRNVFSLEAIFKKFENAKKENK